jgi:hypothetical protein
MKVFDIKDNNVFITPETLSIEVFKNIYSKDKSKDKTYANDVIAFIYHTCDSNSPYADHSLEERDSKVIEEVLVDKKFKVTKEIKDIQDLYKRLILSPLERLLESTKNSIQDITNYLNEKTTDPDELKIKLDMMSKFSKFINEYQGLEKTVKKEKESNKGRVRGDVDIEERYNV